MTLDFASSIFLPQDTCQLIHFTALSWLLDGKAEGVPPESVNILDLAFAKERYGKDILLFHPDYVESVFDNVTLGIFLKIEMLYCSKLCRSPKIVWNLINKHRERENQSPISYEAIWAICGFLQKRRQDITEANIVFEAENWFVILLSPDYRGKYENEPKAFSIVCIINSIQQAVIAYRVTIDPKIEEDFLLAVYDAFVYQRRPSVESFDGLVWRIPKKIFIDHRLPIDKLKPLTSLGIDLSNSLPKLPDVVSLLQSDWVRDLRDEKVSINTFGKIFNNYLKNAGGFDLLKQKKLQWNEYHHSKGYRNDPAEAFPLLRELLPLHHARINDKGCIDWKHYEYQNEWLPYWAGSYVDIRLSQHSAKHLWVYLGNEILGRAEKI